MGGESCPLRCLSTDNLRMILRSVLGKDNVANISTMATIRSFVCFGISCKELRQLLLKLLPRLTFTAYVTAEDCTETVPQKLLKLKDAAEVGYRFGTVNFTCPKLNLCAMPECMKVLEFLNPHTLDLSGCQALSDVSALGQCGSLQTLKLSGCKALSDVSALGGCEKLRTLDLSGCKALSDVSALRECKNLHTLDLSYCEALSDVSALGECINLHTLILSGCQALSDVSALGECINLHTLDLSNCSGLTDSESLMTVLKLLAESGLESLDLQNTIGKRFDFNRFDHLIVNNMCQPE